MDNLVIYKADIGGVIQGRTIEVEAHTALSAYEKAIQQVNKDNLETLIQIRDSRDFIVYSSYDQDGLFPKMRE